MPKIADEYRTRCALAAAFVAALAGNSPVSAQQSTAATYDDWVVRCVTEQGPPPKKACDMDQITKVQGQPNPLSRVAISRPVKDQPIKLVIQLPVNISLSAPVRLHTGEKDPGTATPFQRCLPAGCFAELELRDDVVKRLRTATERGRITFKDAGERDVVIPLSFKGFGNAFDALAKE